MRLLLLLVFILVAPYVVLTLVGLFVPTMALARATRGRISLTLFFALTGIAHFIKTEALVSMLPAWAPARVAIIYLTGIFELLGAIGIWIPQLRKLTGLCLIIMLVAFLPANIYAALQRIPIAGHEIGAIYLLARLPIQLLLIVWTYLATEQFWFPRLGRRR